MDMENVRSINVYVTLIGLDQNVSLQLKVIATIVWIMIMVSIRSDIVFSCIVITEFC